MSETATPIKKPWGIWLLEAIAALQILTRVSRLARDLTGATSRLREPAVLGWLLGSLLGLAVLTLLLLALQRRLRRPEIAAPAVGLLWWAQGVFFAVRSFGRPPGPDLKRFLFENVPPESEFAGLVIVHGLLLWLVGSLLWHGRTRAYLGAQNASRSSRP